MNALAALAISAHVSAAPCAKCAGSGRFVAYTGRVVGPCFACKGTGLATISAAPVAMAAPAVDALRAAFESASKSGLKKPALRFDGFSVSLAPSTGCNPGSIYVKSESDYLGKIANGAFQPSHAAATIPGLGALVATIMADPFAAARAYGLRTGRCSCCGAALSDPVSVAAGIGPICAARYGFAR